MFVRETEARIIGSHLDVRPTLSSEGELLLDWHFEHHLEEPRWVPLGGDTFEASDEVVHHELAEMNKLSLTASTVLARGDPQVVAWQHRPNEESEEDEFYVLLLKSQWNR